MIHILHVAVIIKNPGCMYFVKNNKGGKYDSNKRRSSRSSQYKTVDKA